MIRKKIMRITDAVFFGSLLCMLFSCKDTGSEYAYETNKVCPPDERFIINNVVSIEYSPLEEDEHHILSGNMELLTANDCYVVVDYSGNKIYRYSLDGHFINEIGHMGRSISEYIGIENAQIINDTIVVFTREKVLYYLKDGIYVRTERDRKTGDFNYLNENLDLLSYNGYDGQDYRFYVNPLNTTPKGFLKTKYNLMHFSTKTPSISKTVDGGFAIIDSYNNTIYKYMDGQCHPYLSFDLGEYAIDGRFYTMDSFQGIEYLMSTQYGIISKYMENKRIKLVQIINFKHGIPTILYGMSYDKGQWHWFSVPELETFDVHALMDDGLICIIERDFTKKLSGVLKEKIITNSSISTLSFDTNSQMNSYAIAKIKFH